MSARSRADPGLLQPSAEHIAYWDVSAQGRYEEAEKLYKRGLAINEKVQGVNHPAVAQALHNLGLISWRQGKYRDAEELNKRALAIREQALGANHPNVAHTLNMPPRPSLDPIRTSALRDAP